MAMSNSNSNSNSNSWWIKNELMGKTLLQLGLGQLVSLNLATFRFCASLVATQVDAPLTLSFFAYFALALVYGSIMLYRRHKLLVPWYWYVLLGFVDVHGNYLVNKACEFTSLTSVTILDCFTIAWAVILTRLFLGTKYSIWQFFGVATCLTGLGLVLLSDSNVSSGGGSNPLLGDFFVIAGTLFFAMSNVGEEFCVKKKDRIEVIAMIGLFGMLVSASEIAVLERNTLESIKLSAELISVVAGYSVATFLFYTLVPYILEMSGATLLSLSLLTSDMWAVAIRTFFYKQKVDRLYYLAFVVVVVGLLIYSKSEKNPDKMPSNEDDASLGSEYSLIDEENSNTRNGSLHST